MKYIINMLSYADKIKGQGVGSATLEVIELVKEKLIGFKVVVNSKRSANITHIHSINPTFFLRLPKIKKSGKVVISVHFLPETMEASLSMPRLFLNIFYKYIITFYKKADYLVTVNPYFIKRLASYGILKNKVTYIPNYVDEKRFFPLNKSEKQNLRKKYKLKENTFTIICAGQLQTRKGVFDFIECAKKLKQFQFVWAGGISFGSISGGHNEIEKLLQNHPENVTFLGLIERENMNEIYNLADVFFLPSFEELFPMTILEAMNCKIPIVVRDLPIYKDILFNYCIYKKSVVEFVDILSSLEKNKELYDKACKSAFEGHLFYNKNHVLDLWQNFYDNIVNELR